MTICIGGSQHGKDIPDTRDTIEVVLAPPVNVSRRFEPEIHLRLNPFQRIVAKLAGIPTSIPRPIEPKEYARETYRLHHYALGGRNGNVAAYVLEGIDPASPQTVAEVKLLVGMEDPGKPWDGPVDLWMRSMEPCLPPDEHEEIPKIPPTSA
jgi:hypothetical protein